MSEQRRAVPRRVRRVVSEKPNLWRFAAIGAELFSPIIGGSVVGYYIDDHFHDGSIWTLIGLLVGVFLGFIVSLRDPRRRRKIS